MKRILMVLLLALTSFSIVSAEEIPAGKKSLPGKLVPKLITPALESEVKTQYTITRDPFKPPTEILPTTCPPSMPLCRLDYSQLRVVGLIQVTEDSYKALIEDPDGKSYSVSSGQMIGAATITQISSNGVFLRLHKNRRDVVLPMFHPERES